MDLLSRPRLEQLRDALRARGQRPSIVLAGPAELQEAVQLVEEWGAFVELMYLVMAADRRVSHLEREVLRGALALLSGERVRTRHMEAMLDSAARNVAREGAERRLDAAIAALRGHAARAESALVVAAAIAAADDRVVPEEHALLQRLVRDLGVDRARGDELLGQRQRLVVRAPA